LALQKVKFSLFIIINWSFLFFSNQQTQTSTAITERLKRFNDVYTLMFVVITILLTVGASTFEKSDLGPTITFILSSLAAWIFGHIVGANQPLRHVEIQFKLIAWLYASLVAGDVILKYALDAANLAGLWSALCIFASVASGFALFYYLRGGIRRRDKDEFAVLLAVAVAALVLYVFYAQTVVF
jgi:hypothetical protein